MTIPFITVPLMVDCSSFEINIPPDIEIIHRYIRMANMLEYGSC